MPERETLRRVPADQRARTSPNTQAGEFVREEMHHVREAGGIMRPNNGAALLGAGIGALLTFLVARSGARRRDEPVDDVVLVERVRAQLWRHTMHAGYVEADVSDGCVTLRGSVAADDAKRIVRAVEQVPGVCEVINELEVHRRVTQQRWGMNMPVMLLMAAGAAMATRAARSRLALPARL